MKWLLPLWRNSRKTSKRNQIYLKINAVYRREEYDHRKCENLTSGEDNLILWFPGSLMVCLNFANFWDSLLPCDTFVPKLVQVWLKFTHQKSNDRKISKLGKWRLLMKFFFWWIHLQKTLNCKHLIRYHYFNIGSEEIIVVSQRCILDLLKPSVMDLFSENS